jgi:3-oxoacyl-[acyl-carrier protein] reductase
MAGYLLAKHALRGLLREWHLELASTNIVVSALAPEFLDTNLSADLPESVREFIKTRGVYGSMKTVDDVARAVRYLCSEAGSAERGKVYSFEAEDITPL